MTEFSRSRLGLVALLLLLAGRPALAAPCPGGAVQLEGATPPLFTEICTASATALAFLNDYGLQPKWSIRIQISASPLFSSDHPVYGRYDSRSDLIEIMSFQAIREQLAAPEMYGQPLDFDHYRGVIAHEVAHAVVQHNTPLEKISHVAQEYLAHATQLAVLPKTLRDQIIRTADVGPWLVEDVISDIYMAFALDRFAVKCYLHLTQHSAPRTFINTLLTYKWRYVTVS
ncbi:DUF6639 family protein [Motiliproteus sp. SC1-56]|uniref:DUF6639 family protein n=1 Tax=Motiliproteus sp. SC1-56 TaxID=2799565 RepID=UPI001A8E4D55|nr:DUF6639 family protein [Motiliproteus sp. SC1-56]